MKKYICLLLLLLGCQICLRAGAVPKAVQDNFQVIKDLHGERLRIDEQNQYVPFIGDEHRGTPAVGVMLDLSQYSGNTLLCCAPEGSSVFIQQEIVGYFRQGSCLTFDIDSLRQAKQQQEVLLTVYAPRRAFEDVNFLVVRESRSPEAKVLNLSVKRDEAGLEDFFIVGLVILLASYAFQINQFPKTFRKLYDFGKVFSLKIREENVKVRLLNEAHVAFLLHHCLLIAYLLVLLVSTRSLIDLSMLIDIPDTFGAYIATWLKLSVGVFMVIWFKYVMVMLLGSLFGLRHLKYLHVFDFMRMSLIFWSILFGLMVLFFSGFAVSNPLYANVLIYVFIAFAVARIIILYSRLFGGTTFRNVYLFSYICTSEIIPLFVGIELFIG